MKVCLIFIFIPTVFAGKILAPDVDNYLLVTVRNDTSFEEFNDLFNFYLKIRTSCETCIPPITNIFTTAYFGQLSPINFNKPNTTAQIEEFISQPIFKSRYFERSKTKFSNKICISNCTDIEYVLDLISIGILQNLPNPSERIRKKQISIITNYYYEPGFDGLLNKTFYDRFMFTFINVFVPYTDFMNITEMSESKFPVTIFDMSDKSINFTEAEEAFLNRYIDFDYENAMARVVGFVEIASDYSSASGGLAFFSSVFETGLCQLKNDSEYYKISVLIYRDYSYSIQKFDIIVPNLVNYTQTYFNTISADYMSNLPFLSANKTLNNNQSFYLDVAKRLNISETDDETFTFYITDNYPTSLVKVLQKYGIMANSIKNHFEVFIHVSKNYPHMKLDESVIFEEVTSKIISPINASMRANHVAFIPDYSAYQPFYANLYGICQKHSDSKGFNVPGNYHRPSYDWAIIFGILVLFLISSGTIIWILMFRQKKHANKIARRKIEEMAAISAFQKGIDNEIHTVDAWEIPSNSLEVDYTKILGKGSSATIYSAFLNCKAPLAKYYPSLNTQHFNECSVAVKVNQIYGCHENEQFENEIKSLALLGWHQNICSFLGWSFSRDRPCLVFELIPNDLLRYVKGFRDIGIPATKDILLISWQIANGMTHIAEHKLVHRDLACRNILLTEDLRVKIADFGLCCDCDTSYTYIGSITKQLPLKWLSLEALLDRTFSEKSDVWSFGILLFEIFTCGIVPYVSLTNDEMIEFLKDGKRLVPPDGSPEELVEIMNECWHASPESRPTFLQIKEKISAILKENSKIYGYLTAEEIEYTCLKS